MLFLSNPFREVLIFANGEYRDEKFTLTQITNEKYLVAVDGGSHFLFKHRIIPHLLIGDLDSTSPEILEAWLNKCLLVKDPDQNTFDLEKAIVYLLKERFEKMTILGGLGGRFDHTLANLYLLSRYPDKDICLQSHLEKILVLDSKLGAKHTIVADIGTPISLLPLGEVEGITSTGLKYPCQNLTMRFDGLIGSSNEMLCETASVTLKQGKLALVIGQKKNF